MSIGIGKTGRYPSQLIKICLFQQRIEKPIDSLLKIRLFILENTVISKQGSHVSETRLFRLTSARATIAAARCVEAVLQCKHYGA